jgi:MFS family permease
MKTSAILFVLASLALMSVPNIWSVAVAYTLMGIGNVGFAVALQAVVAVVSEPGVRLENFSRNSMWSYGGAVVGPLLSGLVVGLFGYAAAFSLVCFLTLPIVAIATLVNASPRPAGPAPGTRGGTLQIGGIVRQAGVSLGLFVTFLIVFSQVLQQSFYPIYLQGVGLSEALIGGVFAAVSLSSMIARVLVAGSVRRWGRVSLLLGAMVLAAVSLGVTPFFRTFWPLLAVASLLGASTGLANPITMSLMVELVAGERWGLALAIRQAVSRAAAILSPIAYGLVIERLGISHAFVVGSLALLAGLPITVSLAHPLRRSRVA